MLEGSRTAGWLRLALMLCLPASVSLAAHAESAAGIEASEVAKHPWIGRVAPEINLPATDGQPWSLGDLNGEKMAVIHFAASW